MVHSETAATMLGKTDRKLAELYPVASSHIPKVLRMT